jgi:ribosomal protein S7
MVIKNKQIWFLEKLLLGLIKKGNRSAARKIIIKSLMDFKLKAPEKNLFFLLPDLIDKILIRFSVKERRRGKNKELVPVPLESDISVYAKSINFLLNNLRSQKKKDFNKLLVKELNDLIENKGNVKKNVANFNKLVLANKKSILIKKN